MGRDAGFIALRSGIATGAEKILIPETVTYIDELIKKLETDWNNNKTSGIIIVAEGDETGGAFNVSKAIKEHFPHFDTRVTILGHVQRGGSPSAFDRVLASALGYQAVIALKDGVRGVMVGMINKDTQFTTFEKAIKMHQSINMEMLQIAEVLST
jgi:6-phosphofructokinase 1